MKKNEKKREKESLESMKRDRESHREASAEAVQVMCSCQAYMMRAYRRAVLGYRANKRLLGSGTGVLSGRSSRRLIGY